MTTLIFHILLSPTASNTVQYLLHIHWLQLNNMSKKDFRVLCPFLCFQDLTSIQGDKISPFVKPRKKCLPLLIRAILPNVKIIYQKEILHICEDIYREIGTYKNPLSLFHPKSYNWHLLHQYYVRMHLIRFLSAKYQGKIEIISEQKVENIHEARRQEQLLRITF